MIRKASAVLLSLMIVLLSAASFYAADTDTAPLGNDIQITDTKGDVIGLSGIEREIAYTETGAKLPSYYSSRELEYTTAVKDQYYSNLCWAYSAASSLETFQKKKDGTETLFSPLHMSYICSYPYNSEWTGRTGWLTSGGRPEISMGYLGSLEGAKESYLENNSVINIDIKNISDYEDGYLTAAEEFDKSHSSLVCADDMVYVNTDSQSAVKEAIMNYGSVNTSFLVGFSCFDDKEISYCCTDISAATAGGHSILIIGWDDNYSKDNFTGSFTPESNGAWICQNSWGENSGDQGLIYISYEDVTIFNESYGVSWSIKSTHDIGRFESMYQLDRAGAFQDYTPWSGTDKIIYMNKFTFKEFEYMERVRFETESAGAKYKIYLIPVNSTGVPDKYNKWTLLKEGTVEHSGYTSVDVPYALEYGDMFIGVSLTKQNGSTNSMGVTSSVSELYDISTVKKGICYAAYLANGSVKRYDMQNKSALFSIKVQTTKNYRYGDANLSTEVEIADATLIQKYTSDLIHEYQLNTLCADTDGDGEITVTDATQIQKYLSYDRSEAPVGELMR